MGHARRSRSIARHFRAKLFVLLSVFVATASFAAAPSTDAQTAWRLLDYVAVDYGGAVTGGKVVSATEYAEMREFSTSVRDRISGLPANPAKGQLLAGAAQLQSAIDRKASPPDVARLARTLGTDLLRAYPVTMGPPAVPDAARGAQLYNQNCASCHGVHGDAKTPMAEKLDPRPIAFADRARAADRTPFALYQVISQGLEGTAMASFSNLPAADRWALAFRVGRFAYPPALAAKGKAIWQSEAAVRTLVPNLDALSGLSEQALAQRIGADRAGAVVAFLRANPAVVSTVPATTPATPTLALARQRLKESLAVYEGGDRAKAKDLALSAYLDGFEPVEGERPSVRGRQVREAGHRRAFEPLANDLVQSERRAVGGAGAVGKGDWPRIQFLRHRGVGVAV